MDICGSDELIFTTVAGLVKNRPSGQEQKYYYCDEEQNVEFLHYIKYLFFKTNLKINSYLGKNYQRSFLLIFESSSEDGDNA